MENEPKEINNLGDITDKIKQDGLPDTVVMRDQIKNAEIEKSKEEQELQVMLTTYKVLFKKFMSGEEMSEEETNKMSEISEILEKKADLN